MASSFNSRKFNLVPPKTKEEQEQFEERNNSFFYSFILIFCAVVVFFILTLAQTLIINPRISSIQMSVDNLNSQIGSFNGLKSIHGELYIKSQALDSLLTKDIKITELLDISSQLKANIKDSQIIAYHRETTGGFLIDLKLDNFVDINQVYTNSESIKEVENLTLKSIAKQTNAGTGYVVATIAFNINNIDQNVQ